MLEQTYMCHEKHQQPMIMHLLHITLIIKFLNEIIQFNGADHPQILARPLGCFIHVLYIPQ
jgi:hypothetical protein